MWKVVEAAGMVTPFVTYLNTQQHYVVCESPQNMPPPHSVPEPTGITVHLPRPHMVTRVMRASIDFSQNRRVLPRGGALGC